MYLNQVESIQRLFNMTEYILQVSPMSVLPISVTTHVVLQC